MTLKWSPAAYGKPSRVRHREVYQRLFDAFDQRHNPCIAARRQAWLPLRAQSNARRYHLGWQAALSVRCFLLPAY